MTSPTSVVSGVDFVAGYDTCLRGTFDAVVIIDVLYKIPAEEWDALFARVAARLKPGGLLIVKEQTLATEAVLPPPELKLPLVPLIYEQTTEFSGVFWKKNAAGGWTLAIAFAGGGFKEYTSITAPPPR